MAGTVEGGKKAAKTMRERYGNDWYVAIGRKGGSKSHPETRPFAKDAKLATTAGAKGLITRWGNKAKKDA